MLLCLACGGESKMDDNLSACPKCGDMGVPADTKLKFNLAITLQELRILVIWAEQWATKGKDKSINEHMRKVVYGIADRLFVQKPEMGSLTLMGDINELRGHFSNVETNFPDPPDEPGGRPPSRPDVPDRGRRA